MRLRRAWATCLEGGRGARVMMRDDLGQADDEHQEATPQVIGGALSGLQGEVRSLIAHFKSAFLDLKLFGKTILVVNEKLYTFLPIHSGSESLIKRCRCLVHSPRVVSRIWV